MAQDEDLKKMQNELAEMQKKEFIKKQDELRASNAAARREARAVESDELAKRQYSKDTRSGNMVSKEDEATAKIDSIINADAMSYNDWRATMIGLLNSLFLSVKSWEVKVAMKVAPIKNFIVDDLMLGAYDLLKAKLSGDPEIVLASLEHNVHFTDENKLVVDPLVRSDVLKNIDEIADDVAKLDASFRKGVNKWLAQNGYTPDSADPSKFLDVNGKSLDKATFEQLKNDPYHGLSRFLEDGCNLSFTQAPTPRPY